MVSNSWICVKIGMVPIHVGVVNLRWVGLIKMGSHASKKGENLESVSHERCP